MVSFITKGNSESRDYALHLVVMCLQTISLYVFHDLGNFEERKPVILRTVPQFEFILCFLAIQVTELSGSVRTGDKFSVRPRPGH